VSAFSAFFEAHERRLRAFALRRTRDPVTADDLVAATMEVAWAKFDDVNEGAAFGWLCGVAIRLQANEAKVRRRRERHVARLAAEAGTKPVGAELGSSDLLPEEREAIALTFERLTADDRELLRLQAWEGLDDDELAAAFDITAVAARKRLSRARQRFREVSAQVTAEPSAGLGGGGN
jgi:RNA polymerase sigma-70 factor (ECF subfamily)